MHAYAKLLPELEDAVGRSPAARTATVARIGRLFVGGARSLSEDHVRLFDDVLGRLIDDIESHALAELSRTLAPIPNAPVGVVRRLAHNDDISVAGPVLTQSRRLSDDDLVAIARSKGQGHLLAIAGRPELDPTVTDLLVRRGERDVLRSLARNATALISAAGYVTLVKRAREDGILAEHMGRRPDLPDLLLDRLVTQASAVVQRRLLAAVPAERQADVKRIVAKIASDLRTSGREYAGARLRVLELRKAGLLDEATLFELAKAGESDQVTVALALLAQVPMDVVDRLFGAGKADPVVVLCKALRYSWPTAAAVLSPHIPPGSPAYESAYQQFDHLAVSTAQRIVHFWRTQPPGGTGP